MFSSAYSTCTTQQPYHPPPKPQPNDPFSRPTPYRARQPIITSPSSHYSSHSSQTNPFVTLVPPQPFHPISCYNPIVDFVMSENPKDHALAFHVESTIQVSQASTVPTFTADLQMTANCIKHQCKTKDDHSHLTIELPASLISFVSPIMSSTWKTSPNNPLYGLTLSIIPLFYYPEYQLLSCQGNMSWSDDPYMNQRTYQVQLTGKWNGSITLQYPLKKARELSLLHREWENTNMTMTNTNSIVKVHVVIGLLSLNE